MSPVRYQLILCLSIGVLSTVNAQTLLTKMLAEWSNKLGQSFGTLKPYMKIEYLSPESAAYSVGTYTDGTANTLLEGIVKEIEAIATKKANYVQTISTESENLSKKTTDTSSISCTSFTYDRAKALTNNVTFANSQNTTEKCQRFNYVNLTGNPLLYDIGVNSSISTAHVPTNVYDGSKTILMVANWTKQLDTNFAVNAKSDNTLKWQYFGSSAGLLRIFPGVKWYVQINQTGSSYPVDFFDCRSQHWYLMASACPKSVVMMVDKSGSMTGKRVRIANRTISEILMTLTENDLFNIVHFNSQATPVDPVYNETLIQASMRNIHRVIDLLNLTANGIANYSLGLTTGFEMLNKTPAGYAKALFIIGDGLPYPYEDIFTQYNKNKSIRIFAYLVGKHATAVSNMKNIACKNNGFYAHIMTLSDVKENVLKYLPVIARMTNQTGPIKRFTAWTGIHVREVLGRGFQEAHTVINNSTNTTQTVTAKVLEPNSLFVSVSRAAYDLKKNDSRNFYPLLGVAGLDIPISEFERVTKKWSLGPSGYVIMMNNNGYVLIHPNFRPTFNDRMKPFYQNTDLARAEHPVSANADNGHPTYEIPVRTNMIDRLDGKAEMEIYSVPDDFKSAFKMKNKYFYKPVRNTPYSIAVVLRWSSSASEKCLTNPTPITYNIKDFTSWLNGDACPTTPAKKEGITIVPYEFCEFNEAVAKKYQTNPICAVNAILNKESLINTLNCDKDYINRLQRDATTSKDIYTKWSSDAKSDWGSVYDIDQAFVLFHSGLLKFYNTTMPRDQNFISKHSKKAMHDDLFQTTYLHSKLTANKDLMYFHVPTIGSSSNSSVAVTSMVYIKGTSAPDVPVAVSGLQLSYEKLKSLFETNTASSSICTDPTKCLYCNNKTVDCYLLTTNGFIVVSNRNNSGDDTGKFLSAVDPAVMSSMLKELVFTQLSIYDFQGICNASAGTTSSAARLINPIFYLLQYMINLLCTVSVFIFQLCLTFFWTLVSYAEVNPAYNVTHNPAWNSCAYTQRVYSWNTRAPDTTFTINCTACGTNCTEKKWTAKPINNTNLILLHVSASESNCDCSCGTSATKYEKLTVNRSILITAKRNSKVWTCNDIVTTESGAVCAGANRLISSNIIFTWGISILAILRRHFG